jgi:hypothetical protein
VILDETQISDTDVTSIYHENLVSRNVSDKVLVGFITVLDISGSQGRLVTQDNVYDSFIGKQGEVAPGQEIVHEHLDNPPMTLSSPHSYVPLAAHAEVTVIYAEFTDGTTYGDREHPLVKGYRQHRANVLDALQRLDAAAAKGEDSFLKELAVKLEDSSADSVIEARLRQRQRERGTTAALASLRTMLQTASKRTTSQ